jgi:hypothetical protein
MTARVAYDEGTKLAIFSISEAADVANLPLTDKGGSGDAILYEECAAGSKAYLTDGSGGTYVLDGKTNSWKGEQ